MRNYYSNVSRCTAVLVLPRTRRAAVALSVVIAPPTDTSTAITVAQPRKVQKLSRKNAVSYPIGHGARFIPVLPYVRTWHRCHVSGISQVPLL